MEAVDGERSVDRAASGTSVGGADAGRTAVLITGMHRNGTSALARTLSLLGAALPQDLVPPNLGNPRGHWEPRAMVDLNDRMLAEAGSDLYSVRDFASGWFASDAASAFTAEAAQLVRGSFGDERLVVLKDPRTALLSPVWNRALALAGYRVVHVLPLRHPSDVAASLRRRHLKNFPYDAWVKPRGEAVWLRYTLAAVRGSRHHSRTFLSYGALLADWRGEVGRIAAETNIAWPALGTDREAEVDAFLHGNESADGRHPAIAVDWNDLGRLDIAELAAACYDVLLAVGDDPVRIDAIDSEFARRVGGSRDLLATLEDLYPLVWQYFEESVRLRQSIEASVSAEDRLREAARQSWAALTAANDDRLRLQLDAGSRDRQVANIRAEVERVEELVAQEAERIAHLEGENARLAAELRDTLADAEMRSAEHARALAAARSDQDEAAARLTAVYGSTSWRITAPLRALSRALRGRA